jgi:hypothetical protein
MKNFEHLTDSQLLDLARRSLTQSSQKQYEAASLLFLRLDLEEEFQRRLKTDQMEDIVLAGMRLLTGIHRPHPPMDWEEARLRLQLSASSLAKEGHLPKNWADSFLNQAQPAFETLDTFQDQSLFLNRMDLHLRHQAWARASNN